MIWILILKIATWHMQAVLIYRAPTIVPYFHHLAFRCKTLKKLKIIDIPNIHI